MYKRDVAILLVACFAVIFSLQHEGRVSVRKAWYHLYEDEDPDLFSGQTRLPPPVVGDLNGDGDLEVILATHDYKLEVIKPRHAGRSGDGFAKGHVLASVSLLPWKVAVAGSRRPAALAVGYLDPAPATMVLAPRKQVVVVVTAGWHVMCFDHNLKLLWEHAAVDNLPHHAQLEQVAIYISHHQVHTADRGLVVVGGALLMGDLLHPDTKEQLLQEEVRAAEGAGDPVDTEGRHLRLATAGHPAQSLPSSLGGADTSRHFSYFAYEGGSGKEVWKHDAAFLHSAAELDDLADEMQPQENYKLEAEALEGRHYQEASCRAYTGSVLHSMPHLWSSTQDTSLEEAHFVKHHEATGAQKHTLGHANRPTRNRPTHTSSPKLAGLVHKPHLTSILRPTDHVGAHAKHPAHATHSGPNGTQANALVAHLREGIEVIHLFTGRTICQLHLPDNTLHIDINGDGVLDHVQAYTGSDTVDLGVSAHHHAAHCTATATSGIPPRHHAWSARVCNVEQLDLMEQLREKGGGGGGSQHPSQVLPPTFLPLPRLDGSYARKGRQHGILVFMTNKGEVTALDALGSVLWADFFGTGWDPIGEGMGPVPTLQAVALRPRAIPSAVLVAGAFSASLLTEHGTEVDSFMLPSPPLHPLVVADFNGDGLNDFMLVSQRGVFGYQQVHHLGGYSFSALVLTLVISMGVVYFMQQADGAGTRGKKVRSTEYAD